MGKNSNISDEDILKEETQPGVVVYRSNVPEGAGVFDMDIAPGIKEVTIKYDLLMLGCEKSFPDVEKLIIGEDVVSIEILNTLFPNVRWVLSMNYEFETGSYLVYNHFGFKTLLNGCQVSHIFCRTQKKQKKKTLLYRRFWKKRQHQLTLFLCVPCKKTATKHMPVRKLFYTEYYPCTHNKHM